MKFMVVMDPLQTETARFWENHGEYNDVDPTKSIMTEVFELPTTCFAEDEGSLSNSSRWLQWHEAAQDAPAEARSDTDIMAAIRNRLKALYQKEGGAFPDAILNLNWPYETGRDSRGRTSWRARSTATALPPIKDASGMHDRRRQASSTASRS